MRTPHAVAVLAALLGMFVPIGAAVDFPLPPPMRTVEAPMPIPAPAPKKAETPTTPGLKKLGVVKLGDFHVGVEVSETELMWGVECPQMVRATTNGECRQWWGVSKVIVYTITLDGKPVTGVVREELELLEDNLSAPLPLTNRHEPAKLASGRFTDIVLFGFSGNPPKNPVWRKYRQTLLLEGRPLMVVTITVGLGAKKGAGGVKTEWAAASPPRETSE